MNKAVFFDKDGTLIKDVPYNIDPLLVELEKGAIDTLLRLKRENYLLVIISNQAGIALDFFTEQRFLQLKEYLLKLFEIEGVVFDGFYYCPHHPQGKNINYKKNCDCRKPAPGLLFRAARELDIDLTASWMVGDILHDVQAGTQAGCKTILVDNGNETEWEFSATRTPAYIVTNLSEVADYILNKA
jgi:D,D-heptose 1,7-bisphosphate phosphatase